MTKTIKKHLDKNENKNVAAEMEIIILKRNMDLYQELFYEIIW